MRFKVGDKVRVSLPRNKIHMYMSSLLRYNGKNGVVKEIFPDTIYNGLYPIVVQFYDPELERDCFKEEELAPTANYFKNPDFEI